MDTVEQVELERQDRITKYQRFTVPDFEAGPEDTIVVEGEEIPLTELDIIHRGTDGCCFNTEYRWFYRHKSSEALYILSIWYGLSDVAHDAQVKSIQGSELEQEKEPYNFVISFPEYTQIPGPNYIIKVKRTDMVVEKLRDIMVQHGYRPENISYQFEGGESIYDGFNLQFLHTENLESLQAAKIIGPAMTLYSFRRLSKPDVNTTVIEYHLSADELEMLLPRFQSAEYLERSPLDCILDDLYDYLDGLYDFCGDSSVSVKPPVFGFTILGAILTFQRTFNNDFGPTPAHSCTRVIPLITEKDHEMAAFLMALNCLNDDPMYTTLFMIEIIEFTGLERFGDTLTKNMKQMQDTWLQDPINRKWLRRDKIRRILQSFD